VLIGGDLPQRTGHFVFAEALGGRDGGAAGMTRRRPGCLAELRLRIRIVPAEVFLRRTGARFTVPRSDPDRVHAANGSVVCEPGRPGLAGLFSERVRLWRWMRKPIDGRLVFCFSPAVTQPVAERARGCRPLL